MILGLVVPLGASGCVLEITDPVGSDASLAGSWTVEGAAPTAASCAASGITHVRVRVRDGSRVFDPADLVFPCEQGSFDTIDPVLRDGIWNVQLLALDMNAAAGEVIVGEGPIETFDTLAAGGHFVMTPVDFIGAPPGGTAMRGSWTINGAAPTVDSCAALGIDEILVDILSGPGAGTSLKYMCTDGGFTEAIDPGTYEIRVIASNLTTGEVAATELVETFTVADGETYVINGGPIDYVGGFDPLGNDSVLQATWNIGGIAGDAKACEAVLGDSVDLVFHPADDIDFANGVVVATAAPCADGAFDSVTPILAAGDYLISAELEDSTGTVISRIESDSTFTVTAGAPTALAIDFRLDSATVHVFFEWENPSALGTYADCATAGVDAMRWELYRDDGSASGVFVGGQDVGMTVACSDFINVMGDVDGGMLMPGNYELVLEGYEAGFKSWDPVALCTLSIDDAGGLGTTTCSADYAP